MNDNEAQESEQTNSHENDDVKRDETLLPATRKQFTSEYQPSAEAKSRGKMKSKRNRELMQYILNRSWKKNRMNEEFHEQMKEYFQITDEELDEMTYEAVLMFRQVAQAIKIGDNVAAAQVMERAFGKPIQKIEFDGSDTPPAINITVQAPPDLPPIEENENDI